MLSACLRFATARTDVRTLLPVPTKLKASAQTSWTEAFKWWAEKDSNLRRHSQQIYSLPRLTAPESTRIGHPSESRDGKGGKMAGDAGFARSF